MQQKLDPNSLTVVTIPKEFTYKLETCVVFGLHDDGLERPMALQAQSFCQCRFLKISSRSLHATTFYQEVYRTRFR